LPVVGQKYQQTHAGIGQRCDRKAPEQEHGNRRAPFAGRDAVEDQGRHQGADEGGQRQSLDRQLDARRRQIAISDDDRGCGRKGGAARHSDQRGISQRIAEQALHDGAGESKQRADHDRECDPRQPDRPQHQPVPIDARRVAVDHAQRRGQAAERDTRRPDGCGDRQRQREQRQQGGKHQQTHGRTPRRSSAGCDPCRRRGVRHCRQISFSVMSCDRVGSPPSDG
jgi:hypothetical protein